MSKGHRFSHDVVGNINSRKEPTSLDDESALYTPSNAVDLDQRKSHARKSSFTGKLMHLFLVLGPGLAVMLADTDAGCIVTAFQSGAEWGYSLIPLNIILIPVVFAAQELTIRLAIHHGKGQAELILQYYGKVWAWFATIIILVTCTGAVTSELSGVMGVGEIFGVPVWASALIMDAILIGVVFTGSYERVEKIAIFLGLFELVFVITMFMALPSPEKFISGVAFPITNTQYLNLVAANIGAVIMPWMIFYQQSASVVRGLKKSDLEAERTETAIGACLTQLVMVAAIVTTAGTIWDGSLPNQNPPSEIPDYSAAITPHLGQTAGRILLSLGVIGGAMIGAIVVTITASWTLGEVVGFGRSLDKSPREAPGFYIVYMGILIVATVICLTMQDSLITINVTVEILNAVLVPIVLFFTYILSFYHLPEDIRLKGFASVFIGIVFVICSGFGIFSAIYGLISPQ